MAIAKSTDKHLAALRDLLSNFERESGDVVIGRMLPEFAALIVTLADDLDRAQHKVVKLTWALFGITVVLAVISVVQLVVAFKPPHAAASSERTVPTADSVTNRR